MFDSYLIEVDGYIVPSGKMTVRQALEKALFGTEGLTPRQSSPTKWQAIVVTRALLHLLDRAEKAEARAEAAERPVAAPVAAATLVDLTEVAEQCFDQWDKDMKPGKLLSALAGHLPGYDRRIDRIRATLASPTSTDRAAAPVEPVFGWPNPEPPTSTDRAAYERGVRDAMAFVEADRVPAIIGVLLDQPAPDGGGETIDCRKPTTAEHMSARRKRKGGTEA